MPFGDEIMILEDLGLGSHDISELDLLNALFDFPRQLNEGILSGSNKAEDSIDDIIKLSTVISGLGVHHHHHRRRRPRARSYPVPYPVYPDYGPSILPVTAEVVPVKDPAALKRIKDLEEKLAKLFPKEVKLLKNGIEDLGDLVAGTSLPNMTKIQLQVGAVRKAATAPSSNMAKQVVRNLDKKAKQLDKLSKDRLSLAKGAVQDYQKDKATIDRLERVAKAKALIVLNTALSGKDDSETARKMDTLLTEVRRLNDRAVGLGRRASDKMKLYGAASMLSKNADGQAMLTKAAKNAVEQGKPEEAKVLTAALSKHAETARQVKAVRKQQNELWSGQTKQDAIHRLSGRRERILKAITLLQKKAETAGLSEEDQQAMKDAYAKLFKVETSMLGLTGGTVFPAEVQSKLEDVAVPNRVYREPVFSLKVHPNDPSGTFLEAIREAKFSVETPQRGIPFLPEDSWVGHGIAITPFADLDAIREAKFSVETPQRGIPFLPEDSWVGHGIAITPFADLEAIREAKFTVPMPPLSPQGRWFEKFELTLFGDANLVSDTPKKISGPFDFVTKPAEVKAIKKAVDRAFLNVNKLSSGATNAVKLVSATDWASLKKMPKQSLQAAAQAIKAGSKGVAGEVYREAKAVHNYVKSPYNSVCNMISNSGIEKVADSVAPGRSSEATIKYLNKVCGKAGGAARALKVANVNPSSSFVNRAVSLVNQAEQKIVGSAPESQLSAFEYPPIRRRRLIRYKMQKLFNTYSKMSPSERKAFRDKNQRTYKGMKAYASRVAKISKMTKGANLEQAPLFWNAYQPIWTTKRTLEDARATTEFPNIPEAHFVRKVTSTRPSFPATPEPIWVRHAQGTKAFSGVNFPALYHPIWVKKPSMNIVEGAYLAAPLLIS